MYLYQKNNDYFAQMATEFLTDGIKEFKWLGAENIREEFRGLRFKATKEALYNINYKSRLATRVLAPLISFTCKSPEKLYKTALNIHWDDFFSLSETFAIFSNVSDSIIDHSHYASLKLKDAIADYFMESKGKRPNVDAKNPDLWINLYIRKDQAVISIDTSGGSLHKRGYRKKSVEAPMQETLAAEIIQLTEWDTEQPLYDPMCGSGTLLSEALMYCSNTPSGFLKKNFGFTYLPDFDEEAWNAIVEKSNKKIRPPELGIVAGSDISKQAINAARFNLNTLPGGSSVVVKRFGIEELNDISDSIIVCNPPYGVRLKNNNDLSSLYKALGDFLKNECKGSTAYIYFGDRAYLKQIGLKASWKKPLKNGGLDGRLAKFEMY